MRKLAGLTFVLLTACNSPAPPANTVTLGTIDYFDITKNKLYGGGCNFVGEGGGMGAILLAQAEQAVIKLDEKIVLIPADTTSTPLKQGSWTRYHDAAHTLELKPVAEGKSTVNGVVETLPARMTLADGQGAMQFAAIGQAQCKPM